MQTPNGNKVMFRQFHWNFIELKKKHFLLTITDTSENTPSRSGLRKRKRPETPQKTEKQVTEEWIEEDKLQLWEIKLFGEK